MKKFRDMWWVLRIAYKNLWFKKDVSVLFGLVVFVLFTVGPAYLDLYMMFGTTHRLIGNLFLFFSMLLIFVIFPLALLWCENQISPGYIKRLRSTLPEYYNDIVISIKKPTNSGR